MNELTTIHKNEPSPSSARSAFAKYFPRIESWRKRKALIKELALESKNIETVSSTWELREHWERAAHYKERAAVPLKKLLDIEFHSEYCRRYTELLKDAIVRYSVEIGEAGRYDPGLHYRIYLNAMELGDPRIARKHLLAMNRGFAFMVTDPNLDALVRLNRLKRAYLAEVWEGKEETALGLASEAVKIARTIKTTDGIANREVDTVEWLGAQFAAKNGDSYRLLQYVYGDLSVSRP
jgi:hypothetical protein